MASPGVYTQDNDLDFGYVCDNTGIKTGPDLCFPLLCDPCRYDGNSNEAAGYCRECKENLCYTCIQYHRKLQITRAHAITMCDDKPIIRQRGNYDLVSDLVYCDDHQTSEVTYFCSIHKSSYCSVCRATKHAACDSKSIDEFLASESIEQIPEVLNELQQYDAVFEEELCRYTTLMSRASESSKNCREHIASLKAQILQFFQKAQQEVDEICKENECQYVNIERDIKLCTEISTHIKSSLLSFHRVIDSSSQRAKFVASIKAKKLLNECAILQSKLAVDRSGHTLHTVSFIEMKELQKLLQTLHQVGKIIKTKLDMSETEGAFVKGSDEDHNEFKDGLSYTLDAETQYETETGQIPKSHLWSNKGTHNKVGHVDNQSRSPLTPIAPLLLTKCKSVEKLAKSSEDAVQGFTTKAMTTSNPEDGVKTSMEADFVFLNKYFGIASKQVKDGGRYKRNFTDMKLEKAYNISILSSSDSKLCDITGMAIFPNNWVILCDHSNRNVKLLTPDFQVASVYKTGGKPWNVAVRNKEEAIVTLTTERLLQFVKVSHDGIVKGKTINTKWVSWGIDIFDDHMFLTQHNNPGDGRVEIRKMDGQIVRRLLFENNASQRLLNAPSYILVEETSDETCMYLTDGHDKSVSYVNLNNGCSGRLGGGQTFTWPKGAVVDASGNCLVCLRFGDKLKLIYNHVFKALGRQSDLTGRKYMNFMENIAKPQAIAMRWGDGKMLVGQGNSNEILVAEYY